MATIKDISKYHLNNNSDFQTNKNYILIFLLKRMKGI